MGTYYFVYVEVAHIPLSIHYAENFIAIDLLWDGYQENNISTNFLLWAEPIIVEMRKIPIGTAASVSYLKIRN